MEVTKQSTLNFPKKLTFLTPWHAHVRYLWIIWMRVKGPVNFSQVISSIFTQNYPPTFKEFSFLNQQNKTKLIGWNERFFTMRNIQQLLTVDWVTYQQLLPSFFPSFTCYLAAHHELRAIEGTASFSRC